VFRFVRQPADGLLNIGSGKPPKAGLVTPGDEFGESGSRRDGSRAAANLEAALADMPGIDESGEPQDIAADGVRDLNGDRRRREFTDVARIPEVLDKLGGRAPIVTVTTVVAGVLERDGSILICRRRADQPHPLKWEFPGGKIEAGESPEAALIRELREELGIESAAGPEIMRYEFAYPGRQPILLIFLRVADWRGEIENRIFETIRWERSEALTAYDFLEGDAPFLTAFTGPESRMAPRCAD
jgi:8-oxo-dGTP diphosphatase